jgi:hypothetical protein
MTRRVTVWCASLLALLLAAPAVAQEEDTARFSGIFQLDVTNAYFFRGILQEREGVVLQPWAELYMSLYSSEDGFLRDVTVGAGAWNSFHSERTLNRDQNQWWYELDVYPLISLGFAGGVNLLTVYYFYTSPNDAFTTAQEANFKLSWDDSEAFGAWSMQPWVNVAWEVVNTAFGPQEGYGLRPASRPRCTPPRTRASPSPRPPRSASRSRTTTRARTARTTPSATPTSGSRRASRSPSCPRARARGRSA